MAGAWLALSAISHNRREAIEPSVPSLDITAVEDDRVPPF